MTEARQPSTSAIKDVTELLSSVEELPPEDLGFAGQALE